MGNNPSLLRASREKFSFIIQKEGRKEGRDICPLANGSHAVLAGYVLSSTAYLRSSIKIVLEKEKETWAICFDLKEVFTCLTCTWQSLESDAMV